MGQNRGFRVLAIVAAFGSAPAIGAQPSTLLEDPSLLPISREAMLAKLSSAQVISIGESHEPGYERDVIGGVYRALRERVPVKPESCLVESYALLVEGRPADDPMKAAYFGVCTGRGSVNNNGAYYQDLLKTALGKNRSAPVLTHTGFRHILPWGLLFPTDYPTHPLDREKQGTLTHQLPKDFSKKQQKMRSHSPIAFDNLIVQLVRSELKSGTSRAKIGARVEQIWERLGFTKTERERDFEVQRVRQDYPWHRAFITLINHGVLCLEQVRKLLASPELARLLEETRSPSELTVGYWRGDRKGSFYVGNQLIDQPGYLYVLGTSKTDPTKQLLLGSFPDGRMSFTEFRSK